MFKKIALASSFVLFASFTSAALAQDSTLGFQFRVPFQATTSGNVGNVNGQSTVLSFFLDQETEVGILNETVGLRDKTTPAPGAPVTGYDITALRVAKNLPVPGPIPVYAGLHLGNMNVMSGGVSIGSGSVADIFGGVRLLTSKGRTASYLGAELDYRIAKPSLLGGTNITNLGGMMLNLSAGLNF